MNIPQFHKGFYTGRIAEDFTTSALIICGKAIARWMKEKGLKSSMIGYDTRFGGNLFANTIASQLFQEGIETSISSSHVTSAMLILNLVKSEKDLGIMITGGDLPAEYSGLKLKGVRQQSDIDLINKYIKEVANQSLSSEIVPVETRDFTNPYVQYLKASIDLEAIYESGIFVVFDAMYGAAQTVFEKILPASIRLRSELNPSFKGDIPKPSPEHIDLLLTMTRETEYAAMGFALDSDGEQMAMCNEKGVLMDPYQLLNGEENIPWRDGLFIALKILERMAKTGQKLSELT